MMIQRNRGQEIYTILDENRSLNTPKKTMQNETKWPLRNLFNEYIIKSLRKS